MWNYHYDGSFTTYPTETITHSQNQWHSFSAFPPLTCPLVGANVTDVLIPAIGACQELTQPHSESLPQSRAGGGSYMTPNLFELVIGMLLYLYCHGDEKRKGTEERTGWGKGEQKQTIVHVVHYPKQTQKIHPILYYWFTFVWICKGQIALEKNLYVLF